MLSTIPYQCPTKGLPWPHSKVESYQSYGYTTYVCIHMTAQRIFSNRSGVVACASTYKWKYRYVYSSRRNQQLCLVVHLNCNRIVGFKYMYGMYNTCQHVTSTTFKGNGCHRLQKKASRGKKLMSRASTYLKLQWLISRLPPHLPW